MSRGREDRQAWLYWLNAVVRTQVPSIFVLFLSLLRPQTLYSDTAQSSSKRAGQPLYKEQGRAYLKVPQQHCSCIASVRIMPRA